MPQKVCVYPGSFDPFTKGHLDILRNAARLFDTVYVGVLVNDAKRPIFSAADRVSMIETVILDAGFPNVIVQSFEGLLVEYAHKVNASHVIRGLRATTDFEYEFQIGAINRHLAPDIQTMYFMASPEHSFLSSSAVREIGAWNGNIDGLVPDCIKQTITERLAKR